MDTAAKLRAIKQLFYTYRNGIVADTLRRAGHPCGVIFGLNVPQLSEIARSQEPDAELAAALWADTNVRESRLLATYLLPTAAYPADVDAAVALALQVRTREEADMLAFRVLKHLPFAAQVADALESAGSGEPSDEGASLTTYAASVLRRHIA